MTTTAAAALRPKRGWTIVFEGDSNTNRRMPPNLDTWPYLTLMNWQVTWADELTRLAFCWRPELRLRFRTAAVGGSNCRDIARRIEPMVLAHRPQLVLLSIGANDVPHGVTLAELQRTMRDYIRRVRDVGGSVGIVGGFVAKDHAHGGKGGPHTAQKRRYQAALKRLAQAEGAGYLDVAPALAAADRELYAQSPMHTLVGDGHLNSVGALVVAGAVMRWLDLLPR